MPIARKLSVGLALCATLIVVPAAQATSPNTTTITAPANGTIGPLGYDAGTNGYPTTLTGTSDGSTGDHVNVYCYSLDPTGVVTRSVLATNLAVAADGSFSSAYDGSALVYHPCTVLAVRAGTNPSDLSPFHGPSNTHAAIERHYTVTTGPNAGKGFDYYTALGSTRGYADYNSIGSCGVDDMMPFAPPPAAGGLQQTSTYSFYCNGYYARNEEPLGPGNGYRSGVQVDGTDAYFSSQGRHLQNDGGWVGNAQTVAYDPAADRYTIQENDALARCPANQPGAAIATANCATLSGLDVSVHRTMTEDHHGLVVEQDDVWSTTGAAKVMDLLEEQDFDANANKNGFEFPGQASLAPHSTLSAVAIPQADTPASILYTRDTTKGDDPSNPRASTSMFPRPVEALFATTEDRFYLLHYHFTIPAGGSVTIRKIYADELTTAALAPLTAEAEDRLQAPSVAITSPATDGTTVGSPSLTVSGTDGDNAGVSSVTVNGAAATLGAGTFTKDVTLAEGSNTITVVASDATGNTTTATRTINYVEPVPVVVPPKQPTIGARGLVSCPAGGAACTASGTWTSRRVFAASKGRHRVVLSTWTASIAAGKTGKATPKLTKAGRRLLLKRSVKATRAITARAGSGTPVTSTARVTLKRIRHRRH